MIPIVKRLLSIITIVSLFFSCASQESKTSNKDNSRDEVYVRVLPTSELQFPGTNSVCAVQIESSAQWVVSGANEWCNVSPIQGDNGDRMVISVADNMLDTNRSVSLNVSCGNANTTIYVVQGPKIKSSYVDVGFNSGETISNFNESSGEVTITYLNNDIPEVSSGNTIVLSDEYEFDIRVVESVKSNGRTVTYSTSEGNMCNIFSNTSFTLASNDDLLSLNTDGTPVVTPVAKGYFNEQGEYVEVYNVGSSAHIAQSLSPKSSKSKSDLVAEYSATRGREKYRSCSATNTSSQLPTYYMTYNKASDSHEFTQAPTVDNRVQSYYVTTDANAKLDNKEPISEYDDYDIVTTATYYDDAEADDTFPYSNITPYYQSDDTLYDDEELFQDADYSHLLKMERQRYSGTSSDVDKGVQWNFYRDYSGIDIYNDIAGRLWMEKCTFNAGLSCVFEFEFGEKESMWGKIGDLEKFSCKLNGTFDADMLMRYHYENSFSRKYDDIVKYNVIPTQVYTYVICGVPVHILIYTHLGQYSECKATGSVDASGGVNMGIDLDVGLSWSKDDGVKYTKRATPYLRVYTPTVQAEANAHAKISYYPQIEIGLYKFLGPWFEPRPYIKESVGAGFRASTDDNNYVGWISTLYGGLDMRMGLKLDFGFWDKDVWKSNIFNVVGDTPIFTSPKRITLESPSDENKLVDVRQTVKASFKVESHNAITENYSACENVVVVFESGGGTLSNSLVVTNKSGVASVYWTPFTSYTDNKSQTLTAYIYDGRGNVIDKATLQVEQQTNSTSEQNDYKYFGVLAYRLVSMVDDFETLELVNTSDKDIRVVGYLQNAIASRDGDNRLDFDIIITANQTRYVNGYIANECVISSVENYEEEVNKDQSGSVQTSNMPDEYVEQYVCTVTAHNSFDGSEFDLEIYLANPYDCSTDSRQWRYLAKTSLVSSYVYRITGEYAAVAKYTAKVQIFGSAYFNAEGLNDEYISEY